MPFNSKRPKRSDPAYEEMLEYVLDNGLECRCCTFGYGCHGVTHGPDGPILPPCAVKYYSELLIPADVIALYKERHADE